MCESELAREPRFIFYDHPRNGQNSEFRGDQEVRITDTDEKVLTRRLQPRAMFRSFRRQFRWDALDFAFFGGYATWNYLLFPFLFLWDGFEFKLLEPLPGEAESWVRLQATFPAAVPTHCRQQVFYVDEQRHLHRHDYTAEIVGGWAHAAHYCDGYRNFNGLQVPTRRRVRPLFFGDRRPLSWPTLVAIDVHDLKPIPREDANI